jgi:hypothetical protein
MRFVPKFGNTLSTRDRAGQGISAYSRIAWMQATRRPTSQPAYGCGDVDFGKHHRSPGPWPRPALATDAASRQPPSAERGRLAKTCSTLVRERRLARRSTRCRVGRPRGPWSAPVIHSRRGRRGCRHRLATTGDAWTTDNIGVDSLQRRRRRMGPWSIIGVRTGRLSQGQGIDLGVAAPRPRGFFCPLAQRRIRRKLPELTSQSTQVRLTRVMEEERTWLDGGRRPGQAGKAYL